MMRRVIPYGVLVFLVLSLIFFGVNQFSIIGHSQVMVGEDDEPYWHTTVRPSSDGDKFVYRVRAEDSDSYTDDDGNRYEPQEDFIVTIERNYPYCKYPLESDPQLYDVFYNTFSFFSPSYEAYRMLPVQTHYPATITLERDDGVVLDRKEVNLAEIGREVDLNDKVTVVLQGALSGIESCDTVDYAIKITEDGEYSFWSAPSGHDFFKFGFVSLSTRDERPNFESDRFLADPAPSISSDAYIGYKPKDSVGAGIVTMVASGEAFDFRYIPATDARPNIIDVQMPTEVQSGTKNTFNIRVENVGTGLGALTVRATFEEATLSSSPSQTIDVDVQETGSVSYDAIVSEQEGEGSVTFEVCALNAYGPNYCEETTRVFDIIGEPPEGQCDGFCNVEAGDNWMNCPEYCPQPDVCDLPNESFYNGQCMCDPGYEYQYNEEGEPIMCVPESIIPEGFWVVFIVLIFIIINGAVIGVWLWRRNK